MNDYNAAKKYGDQQQPLITNNIQGKQRKTASTQKKRCNQNIYGCIVYLNSLRCILSSVS